MKTEQPILITTIKAASDLSSAKHKFIGFDGSLCGDDIKPLGVLAANTEQGEQAPVIVKGIALVELFGTCNIGDTMKSNEFSTASSVPFSDDNRVAGFALDAGDTGDLIRIVLI